MAGIRDRLSKKMKREEVTEVIQKQLGHTQEIVNPNLFRVTIPTLPYQALDTGAGKVLPWHLLHIIRSVGEQSDPARTKDGPFYIPNFYSYALSCKVNVNSSFYDPDTPKFPLVIERKVIYTKRTSRLMEAIMAHPLRREPYCTIELIDVRVVPTTRMPLTFPELWKDTFRVPSEVHRKQHIIPERKESTQVFITEHKVSYSDTDQNGHASASFYVRIAYDSFAEKLFGGQLKIEAEMHFENNLKTFEITYLKECRMGDVVTTELWEDQSKRDTYYFDLKKSDNLCARLTFVFHESAATSFHKL